MKDKYELLVNILDQLRAEAPASFKKYHPDETELDKIEKARSRAFLHLFLKVKFGLIDFAEREALITEGTFDGGIDAYYIDRESRRTYFIQSKFRSSNQGFQDREIALADLLKMEIGRITAGQTKDENGNKYNDKIQGLIRTIQGIKDYARYRDEVFILANLRRIPPDQIRRLVPGVETTVYDYNKCYSELVFPLVSGTYFNAADLMIYLDLANQDHSLPSISYPVKTEYTSCEITVLFVPTIEIARLMHKYKNSILRFNPRSYLDLRNDSILELDSARYLELKHQSVNDEIAKTLVRKKTNEFALYNNGITMLSDETDLKVRIGHAGKGQLYVKNPQIINGGQTAYTLSTIFEHLLKHGKSTEIFDGKEVMLKVITLTERNNTDVGKVLGLIEPISRATNRQTAVIEADRRSNDKVQIELQQVIFEKSDICTRGRVENSTME
jgi:AIPR protein